MGCNNGKIEVSQKAILFRKDGRFLTMRRTKTAPSRPLYWDLPGGELGFGEDMREGITREIKEETGLQVQKLRILDAISGFDDENDFWVTICYIVKPKNHQVVLSFEHDQFQWVGPDEFQQLQASPRNKKFAKTFKFLRDQNKL